MAKYNTHYKWEDMYFLFSTASTVEFVFYKITLADDGNVPPIGEQSATTLADDAVSIKVTKPSARYRTDITFLKEGWYYNAYTMKW